MKGEMGTVAQVQGQNGFPNTVFHNWIYWHVMGLNRPDT